MSTLNERLMDRVRMDLGDLSIPFDFAFATDGVRDHYNVEHRPIDVAGIVLLKDGSAVDPVAAGVELDADTGWLVFFTVPPAGEQWEVQGRKWRYFSDTDLQVFIDTAMAQHSHNRGDDSGGDFDAGDIDPVEEYPIAILAVIQALWALATDAAFDIDILAPDGVNIPRSERYRQLMEMIGARQTQYDELAAALNIGVKRMEVFTARRTAKNTNRLVPVYLPKEFDDYAKPKRVLFPPMMQGTPPVKTNIESVDINIVSGDPFEKVLEFSHDITNSVFENAIRKGAFSGYMSTVGPAIREFDMEVVDGPGGLLRISLSGKDSRILPYNSYWEIQEKESGKEEFVTRKRGVVRATNNEVVR